MLLTLANHRHHIFPQQRAVLWNMHGVDNRSIENGIIPNSTYHHEQHTEPLTPYPNSSDPYTYGNTGYPGYYSNYQQQPYHSYSQPVGAYQNTEAIGTRNSGITAAPSLQHPQQYKQWTDFERESIPILGAFVGDLTFEEDASGELDYSQVFLHDCVKLVAGNLRGSPLEAFAGDQKCHSLSIIYSLVFVVFASVVVIWGTRVVENILSKGTTLREYMKGVENDLRQVELRTLFRIILKKAITWCPFMIKFVMAMPFRHKWRLCSVVFRRSQLDMGLKLKNRKVAESKLAKFVEDIIIPPRMADIIVEGEVMESINNIIYLLTGVVIKSKSIYSDVSASNPLGNMDGKGFCRMQL
ncbi:hypothetical protein Patl1_14108 [Pistacia atlantica]|uniref:Uncharacterized protein n=1 Tax=Pistacia atlantica TaxID=434234 RepID=A0ACC1AY88_9ROSI|nr:hypothetical protein Patl1_14108 [Pistacia atlantica]